MTLAVEHVQTALAFVIMPDALRQVERSVRMPDPISQQDLRRWFLSDQRVFDWHAPNTVVGDLLDAKSIYPPFNQITVAVTIITTVHVVRPIGVSFIGRAVKEFDIAGILIKRAIRSAHFGT